VSAGLSDPDPRVSIEAVRALAVMLDLIEEKKVSFLAFYLLSFLQLFDLAFTFFVSLLLLCTRFLTFSL